MEGFHSRNEGSVVRPPIRLVFVYPRLAGLYSFSPDEALMSPAQLDGPSCVTKGINVGF